MKKNSMELLIFPLEFKYMLEFFNVTQNTILFIYF